MPRQTQTGPQIQHSRRGGSSDDDLDEARENGNGNVEQLAKSLVRYALACEYARRPIKRQDVNEKVLGVHTRLFKDVFNQANGELMDVFGMALVELSKADRVTVRQKRAAAASDSQSKSSNMWVLQSLVPEQYRVSDVMGPSRPLPEDVLNKEDAYVGLYTMVIALITINGGTLPEGKLERALKRMNANQTTPIDTTERTLTAMVKDGYIVRIKESGTDEETIDYIVGPRGKVEVGRAGFAAFVRMMFGGSEGEGEGAEADELEGRIKRTLDVADAMQGGSEAVVPAVAVGRKRGRPRQEDE